MKQKNIKGNFRTDGTKLQRNNELRQSLIKTGTLSDKKASLHDILKSRVTLSKPGGRKLW
jgi:hypothetical protein